MKDAWVEIDFTKCEPWTKRDEVPSKCSSSTQMHQCRITICT